MKHALDFSVAAIGLLTFIILGIKFVLARMKKNQLTFRQYAVEVYENLKARSDNLLTTLAASIIVAIIISMVSFREVWSNDVFHVVFVASLLRDHVERFLYSSFDV